MNDNNSDSVRSTGSNENRTVPSGDTTNDGYPVTVSATVRDGAVPAVSGDCPMEYITDHKDGNLLNRVCNEAADEIENGVVKVEVQECGHVRVVDDDGDDPELVTDGGECPNCGGVLYKTGGATPGNSPEYKCRDCGWLNHRGRPARTDPPYDQEGSA